MVPPAVVAAQPLTSVWPAKVFAFSVNTQPLIVPASTPLPPDAADMVKVSPARILPSKVMGPELPTLIVAMFLTIQKMLSGFAPPNSVKVIAPFTVRAPSIWIMKTWVGSFWALKVKLVPVVEEMSPEDAYTVFPKKVWLVAVVNDPVDVKPSVVLNAPPALKMAPYAAIAIGSPAG